MPASQVKEANVQVVTIDGAAVDALIAHSTSTLGGRPSEMVLELVNETPSSVTHSAYRGKAAVLTVDGNTIFTGHVYRITKRQSDLSVYLTCLDKRWLMNRLYVGYSFLDTLDGDGLPTTFNGLRGLGQNVVFNLNGRPNKSKTALEFVHIGAENVTVNADYWTYGNIIDFIWTTFIPDVTKPNIPTTGGLAMKAEEMDLSWMPAADALDAVFAKTRAQWCLNGAGTAFVFDIDNPLATLALTMRDPASEVSPSLDDLTTPDEFIVEDSIDDAVAQLDIVGGKQTRDETLSANDFTSYIDTDIEAAPGWVTRVSNGAWQNFNIDWYSNVSNGADGGTLRHVIKRDIFEARKIGKNLLDGEKCYSILPALAIARNKEGELVAIDSEGEIDPVSPLENLQFQYPDGCSINPDEGYIQGRWRNSPPVVPGITYHILPYSLSIDPPFKFTASWECAHRAWVSSAAAVSGAPSTMRRAIVRDEFIHRTRAAVQVTQPIEALFNYGTLQFLIGLARAMPAGSTADFPSVINAPLLPFEFTITMPAGIVVDGLAPLNEIKEVVDDEVGAVQINGRGSFPSWRALEPGTRLTAALNHYELTGKEIVSAVTFDGETQSVEFSFTSRLGPDITELANAFVDQRSFARPV